MNRLQGKVALITGAGSGLGIEFNPKTSDEGRAETCFRLAPPEDTADPTPPSAASSSQTASTGHAELQLAQRVWDHTSAESGRASMATTLIPRIVFSPSSINDD